MRLGELTNLKWENIYLEGKMIIFINDTSFSTKSRKDRNLPMSKKVLELLQKKDSSKQMSVYVFSKSGEIKFNNDYVTKNFKKSVRKQS